MTIENLSRLIQMRDTKSNIENFDGDLEEIVVSYATDTDELGVYTNSAWVWIDVSGTGGIPVDVNLAEVAARVYNDANITLSTGSDTPLTFNSERFDTASIHSTSSNTGYLTPGIAGKYIIVGNAAFAQNATGNRQLYIRLNGSTDIGRVTIDANAASMTRLSISTIYELDDDDYVELIAYQNSGGNLDVVHADERSPEFMIARISRGGGHAVQDDGTPVAARANLDFVGFTITDDEPNDATVITARSGNLVIYDDNVYKVTGSSISFNAGLKVHVTGSAAYIDWTGSSGGSGHIIQDDGSPLTSRTNLNFVGSSFTVWDDVDNNSTIVSGTAAVGPQGPPGPTGTAGPQGIQGPPGSSSGGSNLLIYDDSVFKVTGTAVSFDDRLTVSVTGSIAYISDLPVAAFYTMNTGTTVTIINNVGASSGTVNFDYKLYDTHDAMITGNNCRFVVPISGYYHISASFIFQSTTTWAVGERGIISVAVNDVTVANLDRVDNYGATAALMFLRGECDYYLNVNDTVKIQVQQNSGGNLVNNAVDRISNKFSIHRI